MKLEVYKSGRLVFGNIKCIECDTIKQKKPFKSMPRGNSTHKRTVCVDATGRQWNGNQCPDCKYGRLDDGLREIREKLRR